MNQDDLEVLQRLSQPFSANVISERKGAQGKKFSYINVHHVRERLDQAVGINWSWEITETRHTNFMQKTKGTWDSNSRSWVLPPGAAEFVELPGVTVSGRLTIHLPSGLVVYRDGNGGASSDKGMGPGDAEKIAASNALKRAAWMFGVGKEFALDSEEALDDTTTFNKNKAANKIASIPTGSPVKVPEGFTPNTVYGTGNQVQSVQQQTVVSTASRGISIPGFK